MNWSRTKSIFIICFLLLDVFLVFEMYMRQQDESVEDVSDSGSKYSNYEVETVIPSLPKDITFLRGTRIYFNQEKEALVQLLDRKDNTEKQKITLEEDGRQLTGLFSKPKTLGRIEKNEDVQKALLSMVYQGQDYKFWEFGADKSTVKFVQTYHNRPVYVSTRNRMQMLDFTVQDNQVTGFRQNYFKLSSNQKNHVDLINAEQAIKYLADRTDLVGYKTLRIRAIELCYLNTVGDGGADPLIFVPAWHITVHTNDHTSDYFVNAVSGNVQSVN
ncbi:two-component system regulatory protein YycI [Sporolactobacillus shoreicorticis]|uniref:Two-component system regulatory protein YycI n=1 Tax=Sporolactobacillus shoreicorticis TaxID=1923877 RepID=A0ABW5S870_9BACL|nr:two-component system regulatory protein YycI [Sporolactobacillus shoreicorticis]MCO7126072.1 two-component system regulatory protein YycI [Sporolactobacillus shoreicorticis]